MRIGVGKQVTNLRRFLLLLKIIQAGNHCRCCFLVAKFTLGLNLLVERRLIVGVVF